jgi:hypothetical protein
MNVSITADAAGNGANPNGAAPFTCNPYDNILNLNAAPASAVTVCGSRVDNTFRPANNNTLMY